MSIATATLTKTVAARRGPTAREAATGRSCGDGVGGRAVAARRGGNGSRVVGPGQRPEPDAIPTGKRFSGSAKVGTPKVSSI